MSATENMIELARNSVQTWECDRMGHLNVQFYAHRAEAGVAALLAALGLGPRALEGAGVRVRTRSHHIRFLREQLPGAPHVLRGGVLRGGVQDGPAPADGALWAYMEMLHSMSGEVSAAITAEIALEDRDGSPFVFPSGVREAMAAHAVAAPPHGLPRGLDAGPPRPAPRLQEAQDKGMLQTFQGLVTPGMCDSHGDMTPRFFLGVISDSIPNLIAQSHGADRSADTAMGGAAAEYRLVYRGRPRAGDLLALFSALRRLERKTYVWTHWMFDLESGVIRATAEAVAVALNLETRRAVEIPETVRARLAPLVTADVSI